MSLLREKIPDKTFVWEEENFTIILAPWGDIELRKQGVIFVIIDHINGTVAWDTLGKERAKKFLKFLGNYLDLIFPLEIEDKKEEKKVVVE